MPAGHVASVIAGHRAGWLRCRITEPVSGQPFYSESPTVREAEVFTIGGTTTVEHAEVQIDVPLGESAGVPGQRFTLPAAPVLPDAEPVVVQVSVGEGWQDWVVVEDFGASGPDDRHVVLDASNGEFLFPPAVREADGTLRRYGAVPPKGAVIQVPRYRTGGGRSGNVARGAISVLRSSVPYVSEVENREAAIGGVDAETVAEAKLRVPNQLRVQERAVTAEDHELIARQAVPSLAQGALPAHRAAGRVCCWCPTRWPTRATGCGSSSWCRPTRCSPRWRGGWTSDVCWARAWWWNHRTTRGSPWSRGSSPRRRGPTGCARTRSPRCTGISTRCAAVRTAVGWEFGRPVQFGEVFAVLQRVAGVTLVEEVRLFPANPLTGVRGAPVERLDVAPNALVFSHQHQVAVGAP